MKATVGVGNRCGVAETARDTAGVDGKKDKIAGDGEKKRRRPEGCSSRTAAADAGDRPGGGTAMRIAAMAGALVALIAGAAVAQETRPNILVIMGDDIGWTEL